ncbi:hypothetical protein HDU87_002598 [Geranomyces variabilis]|uniref:Uncharacterized protein n=1 Tax=Geranomyces variabilis TaxID=109894 RepID=A0AAD5XVT6_9FUNG|nr:hypothetical protein HDU87_002598 [Geranomyces variabilis]
MNGTLSAIFSSLRLPSSSLHAASHEGDNHAAESTSITALEQWARNVEAEDLKRASIEWCCGLEEADGPVRNETGSDVDWHRHLYWRLMNVEQFPEVLPVARRFLYQQFQTAAEEARSDIEHARGEESLAYTLRDGYSPTALESFMLAQHQRTMDAYHAYREEWDRKKKRAIDDASGDDDDSGWVLRHANALHPTKEYAKWWLLQNAPTKLVDGSWLQHAAGIGTADEDDKRTAMPLYKTFVEELGDGVLKMNHVSVYETCLESERITHPPHHTRGFSQDPRLPSHAYTRGCVQLALGQFAARDLFPEALGYNLGYEQLPLHLLITTHELPLLDIDPTYFLLHVSIDNGATGHAKMAVDAVVQYLDRVRVEKGVDAMRQHWQRILTGFYLSERNPLKSHLDARRRALHRSSASAPPYPRALFSTAAACIFASKAPYAHKIHPPDAMVGPYPLHYWLDPDHARERSAELVREMEKSRWVERGNPGASALVGRLCRFGGPMFAVFTEREMEVLGEWIRGLRPPPVEKEEEEEEENGGAVGAAMCPVSGRRDSIGNAKCPMMAGQTRRVSISSSVSLGKDQARTDLLPLISAKSRAGKFRHGSLTLMDPNSGAPRTINSLLAADDPSAVLDALVASGSVRAFLEAVQEGGCMAQWFGPNDRKVVEAWVASLDAPDAESRSVDSGHVVAPSAEAHNASRRNSADVTREPSDETVAAALDIIAAAAATKSITRKTSSSPTECMSIAPPQQPPLPLPSASALIPILSSPTSAAHHLASYILAHPFSSLPNTATTTTTTLDALHPLLQHISLGLPVTNHASPARHPTRTGATHLLFRRALVESHTLSALLRTLSSPTPTPTPSSSSSSSSPSSRTSASSSDDDDAVGQVLVYLLAVTIRDAPNLAAVCSAVVVMLEEITPLIGGAAGGGVASTQWRKFVGGLRQLIGGGGGGGVEPDVVAMRLWRNVRLPVAAA